MEWWYFVIPLQILVLVGVAFVLTGMTMENRAVTVIGQIIGGLVLVLVAVFAFFYF